jgi:hypothetical protein
MVIVRAKKRKDDNSRTRKAGLANLSPSPIEIIAFLADPVPRLLNAI